jgi:uncharacterized protein YfaS (alpha-2-macroglobulin family)
MRPLRYLILLTLILLAIVGCRDHQETLPPEIEQILGLDRPLQVLLVSPQGVTSGPGDYEAVTVVFNQPMKALSAEAAPLREPFRLEPKASGRFRWKGTATVSFIPNQPLLFGTEYKVIVPAGTSSAGGKTLAQDHVATFTTPGPRVLLTQPPNNSKSFPPKKPIVLGFDQSVDPAKVAAKLSFTAPANAPKPTVRALTESEAVELNEDRAKGEPTFVARRSVVVETSPLEQATTYTLKVEPGLLGEAGPRPSDKEFTLTFTTLGPLSWEGESAYQKRSPDNGIDFVFSNPVTLKALKQHVKVEPAIEVAASEYDDDTEYAQPTLYAQLQPNTEYTVTIDENLPDIHGQKLGQQVKFRWATQDRDPRARMPEGIGVLEAKGKLSLPMGLLNIDQQTIRMARLEHSEMMSLATTDSYEWLYGDKPWRPSKGFGVERTIKPEGARNQMVDSSLDLSEVLKGDSYGFVYYEVESKGADDFSTTHRGLVQVTNLGATAKFSPENSVFVATALDSAQPLAGVTATVADGQGREVWKGSTGPDGRVEAPGWSTLLSEKIERYQDPPMTLVLSHGQDKVFVRNGAFGTIWAGLFDISPRATHSSHLPTAQIYTERGLYLPGEEVQLKGAVRDRSGGKWVNADLTELEYELFDSRDESKQSGKVSVSEFGTFHHSLKIPLGSPTGTYRVDYRLPKARAAAWNVGETLAGAAFRVEEFQPADFAVEVKTEQPAASMGQQLEVQMLGRWLFGSPMQNETLEWTSWLEPATYSHKDYPGYDFGPLPSPAGEASDNHQNLSSGKGLTDSKGQYQTRIKLEGVAFQGDADLAVEATITSSNRRSVTGRLWLPVARGAYRIGLQPSSRFVGGGKPVTLKAVALDLSGQPLAGKSMKLELVRREWNSVRKSGAGGSFEWVTEVEDKSVNSQTLKSTREPLEVTLTPQSAGYHIARVTSEDGQGNTVLSETGFYAEGTDYVPWGRGDGDQVELVPDKPRYKPGETAKILIKSPYQEATALITYERDLILYSTTTKLVGSAPVIEVPLTEEHLPNLYVSVVLLRGRVAAEAEHPEEDAGKPAFKIGYLDLPVEPDSQRLKIELSTDKTSYGPGEDAVATVRVSDAEGRPVQAELSLTAADVGVLNLIDYQTPDFFDTFYGSLPLAVRTAESRTDVIGQRSYGAKGEDSGGGGGYNPDFRSDFRLTAVWEPTVRTDSSGKAEVRFRLPENLTTFRVMATAIDKQTRCGTAETEIVLSKPLMLKPSAPAFARVGDDFQAGVLAINGTKQDSTLKVSVQAEGVQGTFEPQEIVLKAGEEREVLFAVRPEAEGTAVLSFSASMGAEKDGLKVEIPLRRASQRVNLASTGQTTEATHQETLEVPATALEGSARVQLSLAPTILNGLQSSIEALLDYPYGCLEQQLSRVVPMLLTDDLVGRFGLQNWEQGKARRSVQETLNRLPDYAEAQGGLKTWPDATQPNPYLTALALRTVDLARQRGYTVADGWVLKARGYLKKYLDRSESGQLDFNETELLVTRAAALEALTRFDFDDPAYLNVLMDRRDKMSALGKAYLLEAAHRMGQKKAVQTLVGELNNGLKVENATAYYDVDETLTPWLYSSDVRDTACILAALCSTGQKPPLADKVITWLLEARGKSGTWGSTANNAAALSALWAYAQAYEGRETPKFSVSAKLGDSTLETATFSATERSPVLAGADLKPGQTPLELSKQGDGRLYYSVNVSYQDSQPGPAEDQGMTVLRAVLDTEGKPVQEIQGGQIYKIGLSVIAPDLRRFVVLEDPVPAGFEVVKTDFATESSRLRELLKQGDQPGWMTFFRFEDYSDRVLLFADALAPGEHYYEYLVRAQTPGTYQYPAAQVEEMYHPEVFGRTATGTLTIK